MLQKFTKQHPELGLQHITLSWGNPYYTKLSLATIGDKPPDVGVAHASRLPTLQAANLLQELTPQVLAKHGLTADKFNQKALQACTVNGKIFGLPLDTHTFVLFYNTDICKKAGLLATMAFSIQEAHAEVIVHLDSTPVMADSEGLRIALSNLLDNALKFSRQKPQPRIVFESSIDSGRYILKVQDNGIGFNPAYRDKIFDIFNRLHATGYEGTGIGLALVRKAVQRMDGEVWATAVPGEGAAFYVSLRLADAA